MDNLDAAIAKLRAATDAAQQAAQSVQAYGDQIAAAGHAASGGAIDPFVFRALLSVGVAAVDSGSIFARFVGFIALILASVNIFGGFLVTERMLAMYKKKGGRP
jgi:NAD(P) transhydrogenase subunit alpha